MRKSCVGKGSNVISEQSRTLAGQKSDLMNYEQCHKTEVRILLCQNQIQSQVRKEKESVEVVEEIVNHSLRICSRNRE